jgi:hypothetical protein
VGRRLDVGEEVDTEAMRGECQVVIKNDADTGFARVQDGLGRRRSKTAPAAPVPRGGTTPTAPNLQAW